ncbi:MAG: hypothetical protein V5783_10760 [Pontiella sp.]
MQDLVKDIFKRCELAAKDLVKEEAEEFLKEGKAFGETISGDLVKWTAAYQAGKIDESGLKRLMKRKRTTLKVRGLKQAGIAEIRLEQLQNQMLEIVVSSISAAV